jgi:hypothetical protein
LHLEEKVMGFTKGRPVLAALFAVTAVLLPAAQAPA